VRAPNFWVPFSPLQMGIRAKKIFGARVGARTKILVRAPKSEKSEKSEKSQVSQIFLRNRKKKYPNFRGSCSESLKTSVVFLSLPSCFGVLAPLRPRTPNYNVEEDVTELFLCFFDIVIWGAGGHPRLNCNFRHCNFRQTACYARKYDGSFETPTLQKPKVFVRKFLRFLRFLRFFRFFSVLRFTKGVSSGSQGGLKGVSTGGGWSYNLA